MKTAIGISRIWNRTYLGRLVARRAEREKETERGRCIETAIEVKIDPPKGENIYLVGRQTATRGNRAVFELGSRGPAQGLTRTRRRFRFRYPLRVNERHVLVLVKFRLGHNFSSHHIVKFH